MDDPIVEEVRQARRRILAECGGDVDRLIGRLRAADSKDKDRHVTVEGVHKRARASKGAI